MFRSPMPVYLSITPITWCIWFHVHNYILLPIIHLIPKRMDMYWESCLIVQYLISWFTCWNSLQFWNYITVPSPSITACALQRWFDTLALTHLSNTCIIILKQMWKCYSLCHWKFQACIFRYTSVVVVSVITQLHWQIFLKLKPQQ